MYCYTCFDLRLPLPKSRISFSTRPPNSSHVIQSWNAYAIKNCVRSSDIVARYGGDEFIILMNHVSRETATAVAQRIRKNFEKSSYQNVPGTVSVGVCCIINDYQAIDIYETISIADKFMYIAKQNAGNDIQIRE